MYLVFIDEGDGLFKLARSRFFDESAVWFYQEVFRYKPKQLFVLRVPEGIEFTEFAELFHKEAFSE